MSVQIIINGDTANETIQEFATLAAAFTGTAAAAEVEAPAKEEKPKRTRQAKKEEKPAKQADPEPDTTEEPEVEESESGDEVEEISDVELRKQATAVSKAGKREEVKALVEEFGAKNLTSIPQNKRAEFLKRLEEL